jgi:DivIVA domain-containing protein
VTWLFPLLAIAVIALAAGVATGRISGGMGAPESSSPFRGLPADGVTAEDVEALRFTPALRGYRMGEVDDVLDRLVQELRGRDDEIARLRAVLRGEAYAPDDAGHDAGPDAGPDRAPDGGPEGEHRSPYAAPASPYTGEDALYPGGATPYATGDAATPDRPADGATDVSAESPHGRY